MEKYTRVIKPGTNKSQMVETDRVDFYRQYGWEPEEKIVLRPPKKTAKTEPAEDAGASVEEVGTDDNKGEL